MTTIGNTEPTYLDLLRQELAYNETRRTRAAEMLNGDDNYRLAVLREWDRVIALDKKRITDEEAKDHATLSPD